MQSDALQQDGMESGDRTVRRNTQSRYVQHRNHGRVSQPLRWCLDRRLHCGTADDSRDSTTFLSFC